MFKSVFTKYITAFMLIIILLLPWMMDNPNIPKRGMKELHGDLRDRH